MGSCFHNKDCTVTATRGGGQPLFPSPSENRRYLVKAEVSKFSSARISIEWDVTQLSDGEKTGVRFMKLCVWLPYYDTCCDIYKSLK